MASSTVSKNLCIKCGKGSGIFTCRGCQKDFCRRHVGEHQQELSKELDDLIADHDQFRQNLNDYTQQKLQYELYTKQIDEWEEKSINTVHQAANDARDELQHLIKQRSTQLNKNLTDIATELRTAHGDDDFHEGDLKKWIEKLTQLKQDISNGPDFEIKLENSNLIPFVPKVKACEPSKTFFGESIGNLKIEDNGQGICTNGWSDFGTVRSIRNFTSGQHRFRFRTVLNGSDKWLFLGIISENAPRNQISWNNKSCYGWSGGIRIYLDGVYETASNDNRIDLESNDTVELLIDCDQSSIQLTNERTNITSTIPIDKDKCQLPWQINFNLYHSDDHLYVLSK